MSDPINRVHPFSVRVAHWVNAVAITVMISSGWQIYNASQLFPFAFPAWLLVGVPAFACLTTTLAAVYPARRASRVDPVAALRHE